MPVKPCIRPFIWKAVNCTQDDRITHSDGGRNIFFHMTDSIIAVFPIEGETASYSEEQTAPYFLLISPSRLYGEARNGFRYFFSARITCRYTGHRSLFPSTLQPCRAPFPHK